MTKTPKPFKTPYNRKSRCMDAALAWGKAHPSDPFAFSAMYNDLINRIEQFGDPYEIKKKAEDLIKNREKRLSFATEPESN